MQKKLKDKTELSLITKPVTAGITTYASDAGIGFIINTEKRIDSMGKVRTVYLEKSTTSSVQEEHKPERNRGCSESTRNTQERVGWKAPRVVLGFHHCASSNTKTGNAEIIQSSVGVNEERFSTW